jgi:sulfoxide reductase heme-binding subunit YedZ
MMTAVTAAKRVVFVAAFGPLAYLIWGALAGRLGANPIDAVTDETGTWTLRFLMATLAVTPLRRLTGQSWLAGLRRMLGLFAFSYGVLHFLTYIWLDQFFDLGSIVKDIGKRPFITAGFTAFVIMLPLAVTSTARMVRRLGGKAWRRLHRLAYVAATAGVVHYWWLVKADIRRPLAYGLVLAVLLGARAWWAFRAAAVAGFSTQRT